MIDLPDLPPQVYKEIEIFKYGCVLEIIQSDADCLDRCIDFLKNASNDVSNGVIFLHRHEIITNIDFLDKLYKIIDDFKLNAYISTATTSKFLKSTHPLTNIICWQNLIIREEISWFSKNDVRLFNSDQFYYGKRVKENNKEYRGILSIRKTSNTRDYLFSKNPKIDNGIVRYGKLPTNIDIESIKSTTYSTDDFPSIHDLLNEYSKSYFSFVVETEVSERDSYITTLTEKTLIALLTGTMPIILGNRGLINDLHNMGIKTFNSEFGFETADCYSNHSKLKIDSFFECINNVNRLSFNDVHNMWAENRDVIQQNYDLISYLLFSKKMII